jgi:ribA/ribD-fused uncharacterized protein
MSFYSIAPFIQQYYPEYWGIQSYPAEQCVIVHKIDEEWGVFSNFSHTTIVVDGVSFKCSETLFQLMKFKDEDAVKEVYRSNNKRMAKHWEKTHRREDWGKMVVDAMKYCLMRKFEQSEDFRNELERSRGKFIVEDQTSFKNKKEPDAWGVKLKDDHYVGPNLLGRLLMELRDTGRLEYTLPSDAFMFLQYLK